MFQLWLSIISCEMAIHIEFLLRIRLLWQFRL